MSDEPNQDQDQLDKEDQEKLKEKMFEKLLDPEKLKKLKDRLESDDLVD